MNNTSFKEVKAKCIEGRFFPYDNWRDKIFVPPSIFLIWIFVRLKWSGNSVSYLSGFFAIIGGILLATQNKTLIFIGSFGYAIFYLFDYVDGGVSRFNKSSGISGQYIDWLMHSISSIAIFSGIFYGALSNHTIWLVPFGILTLIACSLNLDKHSFAWFSICMHYQQECVKEIHIIPVPIIENNFKKKSNFVFKLVRLISNFFFHENYAIFIIPIFAFINIFITDSNINFRVLFLLIGGVFFFPNVLIDIWRLSKNKSIEKRYNELFIENKTPILPEEHFFNN